LQKLTAENQKMIVNLQNGIRSNKDDINKINFKLLQLPDLKSGIIELSQNIVAMDKNYSGKMDEFSRIVTDSKRLA
jgi:hypothetical protein